MGNTADNQLLESAYETIHALRTQLVREREANKAEPIAIVGMSCRFPGAGSLQEFWALLSDGRDALTEVPSDRWDSEHYYSATPAAGKTNTKWGGFLANITDFDAAFFKIQPREARSMDPQQRLLLEVAYEALENGGQVVDRLAGSDAGVFFGLSGSDYGIFASRGMEPDAYWSTGNALSIAANRLSYTFDFKGPSIVVDTACSSSLTALHLACASLRRGECGLALAGGANIILSPAVNISFSQGGATSPSGKCRPFDARADGMVRSEGIGVVVLKPLSRATADGDPVYAVITGSAVNQDGHTNGLAAPSVGGQELVIRKACQAAGIAMVDVQYVESHGTGTPLGDPIEARALARTVGADRPAEQPVLIGSVKGNIGHAEAAAGVAGVIKVALALRHRRLPGMADYEEPNPHVDFPALGLKVQEITGPWQAPAEGPRIASVSSFGFGGANANLVMAEAPSLESGAGGSVLSTAEEHLILPISARNEQALIDLARAYMGYFDKAGDAAAGELLDACFTAAARRSHHEHRLAVAFRSAHEAVERLGAFVAGNLIARATHGVIEAPRTDPVAFIYSGHRGSIGSADFDYLARNPVSRRSLEECASLLADLTGTDFPPFLAESSPGWSIDGQNIAKLHPLLFMHQVASTALYRSWGVIPQAVIGHSVGEIAAAYAAGCLDLSDAMRIVVCRSGVLSQAARKTGASGAMMAVESSFEDIAPRLGAFAGAITLAACNGPTSIVLSGARPAIEALAVELEADGIFARLLDSPGAGHSAAVEDKLSTLAEEIAHVAGRAPLIHRYSTVTGRREDVAPGVEYWIANLRRPVRFADALQDCMREGARCLVEIGPYPPVLRPAIYQGVRAAGHSATVLPALSRNLKSQGHFISSAGALYCAGQSLDWSEILKGGRHDPDLPTYPWQRRRFWLEERARGKADGFSVGRLTSGPCPQSCHPLLGIELIREEGDGVALWENLIDLTRLAFLWGHRIQETAVFPGAGYIELALAAARAVFDGRVCRIDDMEFKAAMVLPDDSARTIRVLLTSDAQSTGRVRISSRTPDRDGRACWSLHAECTVSNVASEAGNRALTLRDIMGDGGKERSGAEIYAAAEQRGASYRGAFRSIQRVWQRGHEVVAELVLDPRQWQDPDRYLVHPALLDLCFQTGGAALLGDADEGQAYLPVGVGQVSLFAQGAFRQRYWVHARIAPDKSSKDTVTVEEIALLDAGGDELLRVRDLLLLRGVAGGQQPARDLFYQLSWSPTPLPDRSGEADPLAIARKAFVVFGGDDLARRIGSLLETEHARAITVALGSAYAREGTDDYQIDVQRRSDYSRVLRAVSADSAGIAAVVHLGGVGTRRDGDATVDSLHRDQVRGSLSAMCLVQGLADLGLEQPPRVVLVSRRAVSVDSREGIAGLAASTLWGLGRAITYEHPELKVKLVDIDAEDRISANALARELVHSDGQSHVALRSDQRLCASLQTLKADGPSDEIRLSDQGWYVITGGMGGLGLVTAEWLVNKGARYLALFGRRPPSASAQEIIADLRQRGVRVETRRVDVTREAQVAEALTGLRASASIRGVIHAAGNLDDGLIAQMTPERFMGVVRTKMDGGWLLHSHTRNDPLDLFVTFSSVAALLGSPAQANYAAGNAFLDALADYRRASGMPGLSINWGPWQQVGGLARADGMQRLADLGFAGITPEIGSAALETLIETGVSQAGVISADWSKLFAAYPLLRDESLFADIAAHWGKPPSVPATHAALDRSALLELAPSQRAALLEDYLLDQLCRTIGADRHDIDRSKPLNLLGIDSLMALETKNRVEASLGVSIPLVRFLEGLSIADIAVLLADQTADATRRPEATCEPPSAPPVESRDSTHLPGDVGTSVHLTGELRAQLETMTEDELDTLLTALIDEEERQPYGA
jgi:myxalamid-type polyketide synthase MxaE and MxaD